jgi:hypothetical protein
VNPLLSYEAVWKVVVEESRLKVIEEEWVTGAATYMRMKVVKEMMMWMTETTVIAPCIC